MLDECTFQRTIMNDAECCRLISAPTIPVSFRQHGIPKPPNEDLINKKPRDPIRARGLSRRPMSRNTLPRRAGLPLADSGGWFPFRGGSSTSNSSGFRR